MMRTLRLGAVLLETLAGVALGALAGCATGPQPVVAQPVAPEPPPGYAPAAPPAYAQPGYPAGYPPGYGQPNYARPVEPPVPGQPGAGDFRARVLSRATGTEDGVVQGVGEGRLLLQPEVPGAPVQSLPGVDRNVRVFAGDAQVDPGVLQPGTPVRVYYRVDASDRMEIVGIDVLARPDGYLRR
jgi:hypothetical protein